MQSLSKFNEILHRERKVNPKIHTETQKTSNRAILSKKANAGGVTIPNFEQHYRAITIKTAWYWHKNRHENQWIRLETNTNNRRQQPTDLQQRNPKHMMEKTASSTNVGKTGYPHVED
jgi:hypothetical protein